MKITLYLLVSIALCLKTSSQDLNSKILFKLADKKEMKNFWSEKQSFSSKDGVVLRFNKRYFFLDSTFTQLKEVPFTHTYKIGYYEHEFRFSSLQANKTTAFFLQVIKAQAGHSISGKLIDKIRVEVVNKDGLTKLIEILPAETKRLTSSEAVYTTDEGLYYLVLNLEGAMNYELFFVKNDGTYSFIPTDQKCTELEKERILKWAYDKPLKQSLLKIVDFNRQTNSFVCLSLYADDKARNEVDLMYIQHYSFFKIRSVEINAINGLSSKETRYDFPKPTEELKGMFYPCISFDPVSQDIILTGLDRSATTGGFVAASGHYIVRLRYLKATLVSANFENSGLLKKSLGIDLEGFVGNGEPLSIGFYCPIYSGTDEKTDNFVFSYNLLGFGFRRYFQFDNKGTLVNIKEDRPQKEDRPKKGDYISEYRLIYGKQNGHPVDMVNQLAVLYTNKEAYQSPVPAFQNPTTYLVVDKENLNVLVYKQVGR